MDAVGSSNRLRGVPAEFLAICAVIEVVVRLFVSRFDDELRTGSWVSYWWKHWWERLRR